MGTQKKRIRMLSRAMSSHLRLLREAAEGGFEVEVKSGEIRHCFLSIGSSCCHILEAKEVFAIWNQAGRWEPRVRCHSTYGDRVRDRKCSSRVVAATTVTKRSVEDKQAEAASLGGKGCNKRRAEVQSKRAVLLSKQFLAGWPSLLEEFCGGDGVAAEDLYSFFTFEPLQDLHVRVSRARKLCFVHHLPFDESYTHSGGPAGEQKSLSLVKPPLSKARIAIPTHIEENFRVPGLHVDFAKKEQRA